MIQPLLSQSILNARYLYYLNSLSDKKNNHDSIYKILSTSTLLSPLTTVASEPPQNITDATLEGPDPPYWKTVTLNYTCIDGYLTADGTKWTNVTFDGTSWILSDPDFACLIGRERDY